MKRLFAFLLTLAAVVSLSSCSMEDKLTYKGVVDVAFEPWNELTVYARVDNRMRKDVVVEEMDGKIYYRGNQIGTMTLDGKVVISGKKESTVTIPVRLGLTNPLSAAGILSNPQDALYDITLDVEATVKLRGARKTISRENMVLSNFLPNFAF